MFGPVQVLVESGFRLSEPLGRIDCRAALHVSAITASIGVTLSLLDQVYGHYISPQVVHVDVYCILGIRMKHTSILSACPKCINLYPEYFRSPHAGELTSFLCAAGRGC